MRAAVTVTLRQSVLLVWFVVASLGADARRPDLAIIEKAAGFVGFYTLDGLRVASVRVAASPTKESCLPTAVSST